MATDILKIYTFGGLSIQQIGNPVNNFVSRKADALFVYLAHERGEHPRELLGELLWDDLTQTRTMGNLRTVLSSLQNQLAPYLIVTRQTIAINPDVQLWLDTQEFETELDHIEKQAAIQGGISRTAATSLKNILELFKGDFLAGFNLRDSRGFEGWQMLQRERLRGRVIEAKHRLVEHHLETHQYGTGIVQALNLLQLDPLWEDTHRQLMLLYAQSGQRSAAIAQYESCRALLDEELGVEPDAETQTLYRQIQTGKVTAAVEVKVPPHNLPLLKTPFIDRPIDMEHVTTALENVQCRLLTILGPGGSGKTRLAVQVAMNQLTNVADGVFFVNLAPVQAAERLVSSILDIFQTDRNRQTNELEELVRYLSQKQLLIVLDNFEQLVSGAEIIPELLERCPDVKFLVTSRERLNVQEEWIVAVSGMPYPNAPGPELELYGAVQLFKQTALRISPGFSTTNTAKEVIRICKLVQGMPLALELAASCLRVQTCAQVADEIALNLDVLQTSVRNMPERHRSIRATFETSWDLLSDAEQQALKRLAVFRGKFEKQAGQQVAKASVGVLLALQDKSLLQAHEGYFEIHPLLQQFVAEKLHLQPDEARNSESAHCLFYTNRVAQYDVQLEQDSLQTVAKMAGDMNNIRAAWDYAAQTGEADLLIQFLKPLYSYFDVQCRYLEGAETFGKAGQLLTALYSAGSLLSARMRVLQGSMLVCMSRYAEAHVAVREALPILQQNSLSWETRIGLASLGTIHYASGDYQAAWSYYESALPYYQQAGEIAEVVNILVRLGDIAAVLGDYEKARRLLDENAIHINQMTSKRGHILFLTTLGDLEYKTGNYRMAGQHFEESRSLSEQMNDNTSFGVALVSLGRVAYALGAYDDALQFCKKSVDVFRELHNRWSESFGIAHMGRAYHALGVYDDALAQYAASLAVCRTMGNRWVMSFTLRQASKTRLSMGDFAEASRNALEAVELAREIKATPLILDALLGAAEVLECTNRVAEAAQIAVCVNEHPNSEYDTRQSAALMLTRVQNFVGVSSLRANLDDVYTLLATSLRVREAL